MGLLTFACEVQVFLIFQTLHPLLEEGAYDLNALTADQQLKTDEYKVGFVGISNWSLDPAKMNRGILVKRGVPNIDELVDSAR